MSRATCWCFTLNNPNDHGPSPDLWPDIKLMVYQLEEADSTTLHYQGYVEFRTAKRISTLKNINSHAHFEVRRGSRQQAIEYCMKEDTRVPNSEPIIIGTLPDFTPKEDKKLKTSLAVKALIDEGKDDKHIANEYFGYYIQSYRGLTQYRLLLSEERNFKTVVTVIYGPTGTGKSQWCWEHLKDPFWKVKGQWWDGYHNQGVVVIDEFYGWLKYDEMLRLLDRYPYKVEVKGGYIQFNSKMIFITSNKKPNEWYNQPDISHLTRRIENIWEKPTLKDDFITHKGVPPSFLISGFQELCFNGNVTDNTDGTVELDEIEDNGTINELFVPELD
jgi:hypothetical protein